MNKEMRKCPLLAENRRWFHLMIWMMWYWARLLKRRECFIKLRKELKNISIDIENVSGRSYSAPSSATHLFDVLRIFLWNSTYLHVLNVNTNRNTLPPPHPRWDSPILQCVNTVKKWEPSSLSMWEKEKQTGTQTLWNKLKGNKKKTDTMSLKEGKVIKPLGRLRNDFFLWDTVAVISRLIEKNSPQKSEAVYV